MRRLFAWSAMVLAFAAAPPAVAATVSGATVKDGVVWISSTLKAPPIAAEMRNTGKSFVPDLLIVPVGSTIRFPNDDNFFHSVYSDSPANPFDIGFYDTGPGKLVVFSEPGVDDVHCHVHDIMHATIIAVDGPYARTIKRRFRVEGIEPGTHVLHAWSDALGERRATVVVTDAGDLTVRRVL